MPLLVRLWVDLSGKDIAPLKIERALGLLFPQVPKKTTLPVRLVSEFREKLHKLRDTSISYEPYLVLAR
jgi:hypothetical protein